MALTPEENRRQIAYSNTLKLALQQESTRIWQYCTTHTVDAVLGLSFDEISPFGPPAVVAKNPSGYEPITIRELAFTRRWLSTTDWDDWKHWHTYDQSVVLEDPTSAVIRYLKASFNRKKDEVAINAMFGAAKRGKVLPGDDADVTFPSTQTIAVTVGNGGSGNVGLNRAKLNKVYALFMSNQALGDDGPNGTLHMAISSKQLEDLLNDDKVTNRDFLLGQFQSTGRLSYLKFDFHDYEGLPTVSGQSTFRRCPVWMMDGMRVGITKELETTFTRMEGIRKMPYQAYALASFGAARADEKMVAEIICNES